MSWKVPDILRNKRELWFFCGGGVVIGAVLNVALHVKPYDPGGISGRSNKCRAGLSTGIGQERKMNFIHGLISLGLVALGIHCLWNGYRDKSGANACAAGSCGSQDGCGGTCGAAGGAASPDLLISILPWQNTGTRGTAKDRSNKLGGRQAS